MFSVKVLLGLDLAPREKRLLEALLKTYRHLEKRIADLTRFTDATHLHAYAGVLPSITTGYYRFRWNDSNLLS